MAPEMMTGPELGQHDLEEALQRRAAEVLRRVHELVVHLPQLGHDGEYDIGQVKCDVRYQQRGKAEDVFRVQ